MVTFEMRLVNAKQKKTSICWGYINNSSIVVGTHLESLADQPNDFLQSLPLQSLTHAFSAKREDFLLVDILHHVPYGSKYGCCNITREHTREEGVRIRLLYTANLMIDRHTHTNINRIFY